MNDRPARGCEPADEYLVDGLAHEVIITIDTWGVPHIVAQSRPDVHLAQGFNAARDRLFQIDLWRRRGLGLLAEALGERYVDQDRANRLMRYRGDLDAEWASYAAGTREAVAAFVVGVNAYIEWALEDDARLPPEFRTWGYEPGRWHPDDIVRFRTHGLFSNAPHEAARARALHLGGPLAESLRHWREPDTELAIPPGLDLDLPDDLMHWYDLAFAPVTFDTGPAAPAAREHLGGSNNWVIDASRTETGRPMLASDPHRAVTVPSLRYLAHLQTPEMNVIGAGEPGLPGISIGHNGHVAFGLTIWPADVEDLYVYELDPEDPDCYLGPDGSTRFVTIEDRIEVRGASPRTVRLRYTVHGPVIWIDAERRLAVALRAGWLEPGMVPYLASIGVDDARTADEFLRALDHWGAPAVNQVYATTDGDWGWQASGRVPVRDVGDGSVPALGDGGQEWVRWMSTADLPSERNHARGWFASANECNVPASAAAAGLHVTHDWYSSARAERIEDWLSRHDRVSLAQSVALQNDTLSVHAVQIIELLDGLSLAGDDAERELRSLQSWDGRMDVDSREALVFEVWLRRHLRPRLREMRLRAGGVPESVLPAVMRAVDSDESFGGDLRGDIALLRWARERGPDDRVRHLVIESLHGALRDIVTLLGAETRTSTWTWGALHHSKLVHAADPERAVIGPLPRGGSGDTVGLASYDASFCQAGGSTFRMVVDVGNWDASIAMNSPGQSGDPRSPHYQDLFEPWASGGGFPLLYSEHAIAAEAARRIVLRPPAGREPAASRPADAPKGLEKG